MSTDDKGIGYVFATSRRMQVVQVLLNSTEPVSVLAIRERTKGLAGSVISKCLYRLFDARLIHKFGGHLNATFEIKADHWNHLVTLFESHSSDAPEPVTIEKRAAASATQIYGPPTDALYSMESDITLTQLAESMKYLPPSSK